MRLDDQVIPTGVSRIGAAPAPTTSTTATSLIPSLGRLGVGVAVIDTGIDLHHPDLGTVVPGVNCVNKVGLPNDDNGHGTHVAGTVAALNNDIGVVGVAPGTPLYAVKVFDRNGFGTWSTVLCGLDWVDAHPGLIRVANMSFDGPGTVTPSGLGCTNANNDPVHTAICVGTRAGITFVAAAGNQSADAGNYIPGAYDEVIDVAALADSDGAPGGVGGAPSCAPSEKDDYFASFSNYGPVVDLAAPGVCILSTYMGDGYATLSGTSMAAPHVAGAAALYLQTHPLATPAEVRQALIATEEPGPIPGDPDPSDGVLDVAPLR
jgi:subtilisin